MSQPLGKLIGAAAKAVSDKRNELVVPASTLAGWEFPLLSV